MKNPAVALVVAVALCLPAFADNVISTIGFTLPDGTTALPASGSFSYDPDSGYSDFIVHRAGLTFDLRSSPNAPLTEEDSPAGCASGPADYRYGYFIMTRTASGCGAQYAWTGLYYGAEFTEITVILNVGSPQYQVLASNPFDRDASTPSKPSAPPKAQAVVMAASGTRTSPSVRPATRTTPSEEPQGRQRLRYRRSTN